MWPFKKKPVCNHSEILTDWLEDGENNALPDDEQRVYDAFMLLRNECDRAYISLSNKRAEAYNFYNGLRLQVDAELKEAYVERRHFNARIKLPEVVAQFLLSAIKNDEEVRAAADWPLPTKWNKSKKQKKAK